MKRAKLRIMDRRQGPASILGACLLVFVGMAASTAAENAIVAPILRPVQFSLAGDWHFRLDPDKVGEAEHWFEPGKVRDRVSKVPLPWQLAFDDLQEYLGVAWYERDFEIPAGHEDRRIALEFLGVDHHVKVWVNGRPAGEHEGSLAPFKLEITDQARVGRTNTVTLRVDDPEFGTREWISEQVISMSGLWRDVYVEITGKTHVSDLFMKPDIDHGKADAQVEVTAPPGGDERTLRLKLEATAPDGARFHTESAINLPASATTQTHYIHVSIKLEDEANPLVLWELDHPRLYQAQATLIDGAGTALDVAIVEFGMRKIEARGARIYLNNRPIYIVGGWLDPSPLAGPDEVNWAMPGPYEPLSDESIKRDIMTAKSLGINLSRRILRSINRRYIYWADRLGMLIWQGGPWVRADGIARRELFDKYRDDYENIVLRDRNSPSVMIWELFCESFGLVRGEYDTWPKTVKLINELYDHVKGLDGTRLVLDNACGRGGYDFNYIDSHAKSDIDDIGYLGWASAPWIAGVDEFRKYCRMITEYGRPVTNSLLHNKTSRVLDIERIKRTWGEEPWWLTAPEHIQSNSSNLTGYADRFYRWGFDEIFGGFDGFTEKSDWYQFEAIKYQSEQMRLNPDMTGYLSFAFDCVPHVIGAINLFREPKVFGPELPRVYAQDMVIIDLEKRNAWTGENVRADVHFSHFARADAEGPSVRWWVEGFEEAIHGESGKFSIKPGEVRRVGGIEFKTPEVAEARRLRIVARIEDVKGRSVSQNYTDIFVFPRELRRSKVRGINVRGSSGFMNRRLELLGYEPHPGLDPALPLTVTNVIDQAVEDYLTGGGTVLLMICEELDLIGFVAEPALPPVDAWLRRHGLMLGGAEFHLGGIVGAQFIKKDAGLFGQVPFENPIGWPFQTVMPPYVLIGLGSDHRDDVLAGAYGSFLRNTPADVNGQRQECEITGTIAQFKVGNGRLLVSTFDLNKFLALDPVSTIMFNDLVRYAAGDFEPKTELPLEKPL